jgi:sulfate-transporting ATPase
MKPSVLRSLQLPTSGAHFVISHDRWFVARIATHILAFEGDSHVEWFEGNCEDYEADRRKRLGAEADTPHRIRYRRIDAWRSDPRLVVAPTSRRLRD